MSLKHFNIIAKSFENLRSRFSADRREKVIKRTKELLATLPLNLARRARDLTLEDLANKLNAGRSAALKIERHTDLYISTIGGHIEAMGGYLSIKIEFPYQCYQISNFGELAEKVNSEPDKP